MAKRKAKSRKKKKNNTFLIFFLIIIALALVAFAITYLVTETEKEAIVNTVVDEPKVDKPVTKPEVMSPQNQNLILDGTWASYNDGAMLTITGLNYTIELPNVEGTMIGRGRIVVNNNKITFVDTDQDSQCSIKPGVYSFTLDNDEVIFEKVEDDCTSRSARIEATWFKV